MKVICFLQTDCMSFVLIFFFVYGKCQGGHAKTLMFAHVTPEGDSFGETISTLKFAQRVSTVELGAARLNKESSEVLQLKEQVNTSIQAFAFHNFFLTYPVYK